MEAKDTVIKIETPNESLRIQMLGILETQAEISFKAGYEASEQDLIAKTRQPEGGNYYIGVGRKAGIKEVVEWLDSELPKTHGYLGWRHWQVKLKEWGIEDA